MELTAFYGLQFHLAQSLQDLPHSQSTQTQYSRECLLHVHLQHEFKDACILALTETWLKDRDLDSELVIHRFGASIHLDRDVSMNERWCKTVLLREGHEEC